MFNLVDISTEFNIEINIHLWEENDYNWKWNDQLNCKLKKPNKNVEKCKTLERNE